MPSNSPTRVVVLISGSGSNLQALIDAQQESSFSGEIVAVVSNRPDAFGLERAQQAGIATAVVDHKAHSERAEFDQALLETIDTFQADLIVLAGFMRILTPAFTQHYEGKMLNIHPSLLPKYQGLHTHKRAIEAGDSHHGVTVHFVTAELDGGPAVIQAKLPIMSTDSPESLAKRVQIQEHSIYPMAVQWFCQDRLSLQKVDGKELCLLDNEPLPACGHLLRVE